MRKTPQLTHDIPPPEVITEILYRLPAKSVGRFRCVSKGWLSLLTDPQFIQTHTNNTLNNQHHLIFKSLTESRFWYPNRQPSFNLYSHPFHEIVLTTPTKVRLDLNLTCVEEINFSSSCNGLLLVRVCCGECAFALFLVNPTTKESLHLPQDYYDDFQDEMDDDYVFDKCTNFMYGFGYDFVTDDYKVVIVTYFYYYRGEVGNGKVNALYVYVYSLKSGILRRVIDYPCCYNDVSRDGVFVNGFIHWIGSKDRSRSDGLPVIAAFSLEDESFREIPFPRFCSFTNELNTFSFKLVVLDGKLAIFKLRNRGEIWLMNEYGVRESWTKISLHGLNKIPIFKPEVYRDSTLVMNGNAKKIMVANNDRMMVYEVEKRTFSETVCVWNPNNFLVLGSYVESLVSLEDNITEQKPTNSVKEYEGKAYDEDACKGEENTHPERQSGKRKDICSSSFPSKHIRVNSYSGLVDIPGPSSRELLDPELIQHRLDDHDSWKEKHQEEKLRADRLEGKVNHTLRELNFLTHRVEEIEATIDSKLVEIQSFERRAREQEVTLVEKNEELLEKGRALDTANAKIESLKARLAMADHERR